MVLSNEYDFVLLMSQPMQNGKQWKWACQQMSER
jgi:hypothetical protein